MRNPKIPNFNREKKQSYISNFKEKNKNISWPPKEELKPYVKHGLDDLIQEEIIDVLKPQLNAMNTSMNSGTIVSILNNIKVDIAECISFEEYYTKTSNIIFTEIENKAAELLGQPDSCGWFN